MMPQRSEHRLRYLRRGERKVCGKKTKHSLEALKWSDQPVRTADGSLLLFDFYEKTTGGAGKEGNHFFQRDSREIAI